MSRDIFHQTRLLRAPSNLALNTSREGASTVSLGNLFQCFTTLMVKNFFLISNLYLPPFSLEPFPPCPKKSLSILPLGPLQVLEGCYKVTPETSLLQAEQPQLSQPVLVGEVLPSCDSQQSTVTRRKSGWHLSPFNEKWDVVEKKYQCSSLKLIASLHPEPSRAPLDLLICQHYCWKQ